MAALSGCSFDAEAFTVPDHPELGGSVVTGVIPTTAFVGWRLGDRRFLVAVESDGDGPEAVAAAQGAGRHHRRRRARRRAQSAGPGGAVEPP